jgi:hypothetical protein
MKQLRLYRSILREEGWAALVKKTGKPAAIGLFLFFLLKGIGWAALVKKTGKPAAIGLFLFFLLKGIGWLVLAYGGFELLF